MNILGNPGSGDINQQWIVNRDWMYGAIGRKDVIRVTADPSNVNNILFNNPAQLVFSDFNQVKTYMNSFAPGSNKWNQLGFYGKEVHTLIHNGYTFNSTTKQFFKP